MPASLVGTISATLSNNTSENAIAEVAAEIRPRLPNATSDEVIDFIIMARCPKIDPAGGMTTAEQRQAQTNFMKQVNMIVSATEQLNK